MASDRKREPPPKARPKTRDGDEHRTGVKVTKDHLRRAEELIREHGWDHWREKP
jgi:hypothetical protein